MHEISTFNFDIAFRDIDRTAAMFDNFIKCHDQAREKSLSNFAAMGGKLMTYGERKIFVSSLGTLARSPIFPEGAIALQLVWASLQDFMVEIYW